MEVVGALDNGTQSTRFIVYDSAARAVASAQLEYAQHTPRPGWLEHDPQDLLATSRECIAKAVAAAQEAVGPVKVKAIGITNQRETTIMWDRRTGQPLYNAVVWSDLRTQDICEAMKAKHGGQDAFRDVTGLPISTYFSAFKARWLLDNVPAVAEAGDNLMFGTVDSWLIYHLTGGADGGVHVTDVSNASRTMLLELSSLTWSARMLEVFDLPAAMMPRLVSNAEIYGHIKDESSPLHGVPIAGCLGDQHAALLGQRCTAGEAKNTYGTGCFMLLNTGPACVASTHGLLSTLAFKLGAAAAPQYALEGSIAVAGRGISWLKDNLGLLDSAKESEAVAGSVEDTGGVYFVPAFSGLYAPHWRSDARGVLVGMTLATARGHVVRAMLEAICFQTKEVLDAMQRDSGLKLTTLRVDGGATANALLMQMQADLLGTPVLRPADQESTALGAALAAGLTVGMWDEAFVFRPEHEDSTASVFQPALSAEDVAPRYRRWQDAVQRSLGLADTGQ
eukprot:jgi/Tetstr1/440412/TSEL_028746.t1